MEEIQKKVPECGIPSAMSDADIIEMVDSHNELRRKEGADEFALVSITTFCHAI